MPDILPDYLRPGMRAVFCGTAVATASRDRGGYYAGPGNKFWEYLQESGITASRITPETDYLVLRYRIGLTDLVKTMAASNDRGLDGYDVLGFVEKIRANKPDWVAFHGKEGAKQVLKAMGRAPTVHLGLQHWQVAGRPVFVLPNASGSNQDPNRLEGRASRLEWFEAFAARLEPVESWVRDA